MSGDISFRTAMWAEKQIWKINFRFCTTAEVLDEQETGSKQRMCDESEMGCVCVAKKKVVTVAIYTSMHVTLSFRF